MLEYRRIRTEQDIEYAESLRIDQAKLHNILYESVHMENCSLVALRNLKTDALDHCLFIYEL